MLRRRHIEMLNTGDITDCAGQMEPTDSRLESYCIHTRHIGRLKVNGASTITVYLCERNSEFKFRHFANSFVFASVQARLCVCEKYLLSSLPSHDSWGADGRLYPRQIRSALSFTLRAHFCSSISGPTSEAHSTESLLGLISEGHSQGSLWKLISGAHTQA